MNAGALLEGAGVCIVMAALLLWATTGRQSLLIVSSGVVLGGMGQIDRLLAEIGRDAVKWKSRRDGSRQ